MRGECSHDCVRTQTYGIYANTNIEGIADVAREVIGCLGDERYIVDSELANLLGVEGQPLSKMVVDTVIVLGGDGTLLRATHNTEAKIIGINAGSVGFLTAVERDRIKEGMERLKNGEYTVSEDGKNYSYRYDTYYGVGFGKYKIISLEEFNAIQQYQNETGRQILYPLVPFSERKDMLEKNKYDANIYYKVENVKATILRPKLNQKGEIIPNYWKYEADSPSNLMAEYNSTRIEGENGINEGGKQYFYAYGRKVDGGIEVRAEYYEYYIYQHTQVLKDGIEKPSFLFGTTDTGKDIFACLAYGARFSFVFATVVAAVNFIVGVIWGSISGYFGGKIDLVMERFAEILGSVPTMIVITLLKYHMGSTSQALVLFIAFFATGWIGMASRTRMQFYRFKRQEYILSARTLGASDGRLMFKHIFPNAIGTLITGSVLTIPGVIFSESSLTYLGIVNLESSTMTSVGTMLANGRNYLSTDPYIILFPALFISLLEISFNLFGNGLRDAFNPSLRGTED